jgi:hypothetical protein
VSCPLSLNAADLFFEVHQNILSKHQMVILNSTSPLCGLTDTTVALTGCPSGGIVLGDGTLCTRPSTGICIVHKLLPSREFRRKTGMSMASQGPGLRRRYSRTQKRSEAFWRRWIALRDEEDKIRGWRVEARGLWRCWISLQNK